MIIIYKVSELLDVMLGHRKLSSLVKDSGNILHIIPIPPSLMLDL